MTSYPEQSLPLFPLDHDIIVTGARHEPDSTMALMLGQTSGQIAMSLLRDAYPPIIELERDDQLELLLSHLDRPIVMGVDLCGSRRDNLPRPLIQERGKVARYQRDQSISRPVIQVRAEVTHYQGEQPVSRRRARRLRGRSRRG